MKALILDTETTGFDEPEAVEIAWMSTEDAVSLSFTGQFVNRFQPSKPISMGAMATHHIMDEDLVDCAPSCCFTLPPDTDYLVGHNVDFDWRVIGEPDVKRICTMALSRSLFPQVDSHSLSAMCYHLFRDTARERLKDAHSAMADVLLCRDILRIIVGMLGTDNWHDLWLASEAARIPKVMPFGKHKGMLVKDLPSDYKSWLLRQSDVDPYLVEALR